MSSYFLPCHLTMCVAHWRCTPCRHYKAVINSIDADGTSCAVTFEGYDDYEVVEVGLANHHLHINKYTLKK